MRGRLRLVGPLWEVPGQAELTSYAVRHPTASPWMQPTCLGQPILSAAGLGHDRATTGSIRMTPVAWIVRFRFVSTGAARIRNSTLFGKEQAQTNRAGRARSCGDSRKMRRSGLTCSARPWRRALTKGNLCPAEHVPRSLANATAASRMRPGAANTPHPSATPDLVARSVSPDHLIPVALVPRECL